MFCILSLSTWIILSWYIKAMVADSILNNANVGREIRRALGTIWIKEKKSISDRCESAPAESPVNDCIMLIGRIHICNILWIVNASNGSLHADKLPFLNQNIPDISSLTDAGEFSIWNICSVHNNRSDCSHSNDSSFIPKKTKMFPSEAAYIIEGFLYYGFNIL